MRTAAVLAFASLLACSPEERPPAAASGAQLADSLMSRFVSVWNSDDYDALPDLFAADVVYLDANNQHVVGRDSFAIALRGAMENTRQMAITPVRSGGSGDRAYHIGRWTLDGGARPAHRGVHSFIFQREGDGQWRIATAHVENADSAESDSQVR